MQLSVELTFYPFRDNHLDAIRGTVAKLHDYTDLKVTTFPTATILVGDFDRVMEVVKEVIAWSHGQYGRSVFIAKFLPDYVAD